MGIPIISEFDLKKKSPLDSRLAVANATARLAITWYFKGLIVRESDTKQRYLYIGDETVNDSSTWLLVPELYTDTVDPGNTLGAIGDIFINETTSTFFKKTGTTTWTSLFNCGAVVFVGTTDPPSDLEGVNGDIYYVNTPANITKLYKKEANVWVFKTNIGGIKGADGDLYATSSATSINLNTATAPLTITVEEDLAYTVAQQVVVASRAVPADKLTGYITSYDPDTGIMVLNTLVKTGTATHTDWDVNLNGAIGRQGRAFVHTEHDITLTQAKIDAVIAGSWNTIIPWSANIVADTRTSGQIGITPGIVGSMAGHSILYDGSSWIDNGIWRGPKGDKGDKGDQGDQGLPGTSTVGTVFPVEITGNASATKDFTGNVPVHHTWIINSGTYTVTLNPLASSALSGSLITIGLKNGAVVTLNKTSTTKFLFEGKLLNSLTFKGYNYSGVVIVGQVITTGATIFKVVGVVFNHFSNENIYVDNQKEEVNYGALSLVNSKTYTDSNFFSQLLNSAKVTARVHCSILAASDTGGVKLLELILEQSTDVNFNNDVQRLKTVVFRLSGTSFTTCVLDAVNTLPISKQYYRILATVLAGSSGTTCYLSREFDFTVSYTPYFQ